MKKTLVFVTVAFAALAIAQVLVQGAYGRGVARNGQGEAAEFQFEVIKRSTTPSGQIGGWFTFHTVSPTSSHPQIMIKMRAPDELAVEGATCKFAGKAVMVVRTNVGTQELVGRASVVVADRRRPNGASNAADGLQIQFRRQNSTAAYTFSGAVARGDIVVFSQGR